VTVDGAEVASTEGGFRIPNAGNGFRASFEA